MTNLHTSEALWLKARLFVGRALEPPRTFDERAFWAVQALELLGKAALAKFHPVLIAMPTEDGKNILAAAGLIESHGTLKTLSVTSVFKRCALAFKPFNERDASRLAEARNEYLHSGGMGFHVPEDSWWPGYWAHVSLLIEVLEEDLHALVGAKHLPMVQEALDQNRRNIEDRLQALIARAQQRLAMYSRGDMPAREARHWVRNASLSAGLKYSATATCPACGSSSGEIEGEYVENAETEIDYGLDGESESLTAYLTVAGDYFSCSNCRLILDGHELIDLADLDGEFVVVDNDYYEGAEYGND